MTQGCFRDMGHVSQICQNDCGHQEKKKKSSRQLAGHDVKTGLKHEVNCLTGVND